MTHSVRILRIVAICTLFAFAVETARAASVELDPGESRSVTLQDAKPVALRLINQGDCSVGIIFRDSSRNLSLQVSLQPDAVIDVNTLRFGPLQRYERVYALRR